MEKPYLIGITGGSGSGKTSFVRRLAEHFGPEDICVVSQDEYYKPREEQQIDEAGVKNFDLPASIDKRAFRRDLERLIAGERVEKQQYTFNNEQATPALLSFEPRPIILVEGLFIFHFRKVRRLLDLKIFLHAKDNLKVIRRIKRDQRERNYPLDDVLYRYEKHVLPTYERYILPYMEEADLVVNNNVGFDHAVEVIKGFVAQKLRERQG